MPPPPPKSSAPAPPKAKAPPPPPGGANKKPQKSKSPPQTQSNKYKTNKNANASSKPSSSSSSAQQGDSAMELSKTAASAAGTAAKMALLSFGSKVKRDVKSFTKSELENAGVDTNKPLIKKPAAKPKPAPAPAGLQSVNVDWKKKETATGSNKSSSSSVNNNKKPKSAASNASSATSSGGGSSIFSLNRNKQKSPSNSKSATASKSKSSAKPKPPASTKSSNTKKSGVANRAAMFEQLDKNAGKTGDTKRAKPPPKKKVSGKSNKTGKSPKAEEKNLKPSLLKSSKKPPPPKDSKKTPAAAPPSELKSVNVDWKAQRDKMANVFKKKDDDQESKLTQKRKELTDKMKKVKASVTAESADPSRPAPKKMNLTMFKSKSMPDDESADNDDEKQSAQRPKSATKKLEVTFNAPWKKQEAPASSGPKLVPPAPPSDATTSDTATGESKQADFDVSSINQKIAKPEDYNEIQFKAVDPMELRRKQKAKGAGRFARASNMVANKPTSASSLGDGTETKQQSTTPKAMVPPPNPMQKKKAKPALPSAPPPKPKPKKKKQHQGTLEVMPSSAEDGWIYTLTGMFSVSRKDLGQLQKNRIFQGVPVTFESADKAASNIRLLTKLDENAVKECMTKKGKKTRFDARYYIHDSEFEFNGTLSTNAFLIPKDCSPKGIAATNEKVINAFMNTDGGILYLGIDDTWNIKGVPCNQIDLPSIRRLILEMVGTFQPKLNDSDLKQFKFTTVALLSKEGNVNPNLLVVRITIPGAFKDDNDQPVVFATASGDKFKKNLNYIMKVVM